MHIVKLFDILKIFCFNCNVDKKKRKIKWKDILRINFFMFFLKKIWLKIICNVRINRLRDGNLVKNVKIFFVFVSFVGKGG